MCGFAFYFLQSIVCERKTIHKIKTESQRHGKLWKFRQKLKIEIIIIDKFGNLGITECTNESTVIKPKLAKRQSRSRLNADGNCRIDMLLGTF